uniref:IF rod domain-containing protein n=1 Tax=Molossus molossus TaxID=27622 RepID=A0A7J8GLS9_MOLMO|nr:hypothetical protein HJG59_011462 [Molossus molossus]
MQCLNDRLASHLERVRSLEADNRRLEIKHLEKEGPQIGEWGHYFKTIEDLRAQIFASSAGNAHTVLQLDNAHLAAGDFRVKYETELAMRQSVESDISGLRKQDHADIRAQYDELARKNREELDKYWSQQTEESTTVVTSQTAEIGAAERI